MTQADGAAGAKILCEKKQGPFMSTWNPASRAGECGRRWAGSLATGQTTQSSVGLGRTCSVS